MLKFVICCMLGYALAGASGPSEEIYQESPESTKLLIKLGRLNRSLKDIRLVLVAALLWWMFK